MAIDVKGLLFAALLDLSKEKRLSKITVGDILLRSGVCRQTFYNHFCDKNDLIYWGFSDYLARVPFDRKKNNLIPAMFELLSKERSFFEQAFSLTCQNNLAITASVAINEYLLSNIQEGTEAFSAQELSTVRIYSKLCASLLVDFLSSGEDAQNVASAYSLYCFPDFIFDSHMQLTSNAS